MNPYQPSLFDESLSEEISEEATSPPEDFIARRDALDPNRSFAVSAPAGSGKTGLLTQRVLKLLSLCDNPEEVLAITFTRKAAGEMQDRILQALWKAKEQPRPKNPHDILTWQLATAVLKHDQHKQWNLLESPQRLRIQTIDSLSSAISRQLPIANGFGATPAPTENPDAAYKQAVHQLLNELEKDSGLRDDLSLLLRHLDNNLGNLENLLMNLLAKRDQWLGAILQAQHTSARAYLEDVLQDIIDEALQHAYSILQIHGCELSLIADWAGKNLQSSNPESPFIILQGMTGLPSPDYTELKHWVVLANFLLTGSGTFRKSLTKNEGFPAAKDSKDSATYKHRFAELTGALAEMHPNAAGVIDQLRNLPPARYSEKQWQLLDSLTRLLPHLSAQLNLVFAELGETDFTGISQSALTALGDEESPTDIALHLDYRIRHILVDEFQDTSSTQLQLLEKLTAGWQSGDGRSLFIVGDGMQSCYSFRNANVGIFLEARQQGIGSLPLESLDLTVNFRSQSGVVEWVNEHFQTAFPEDDNISCGAVKYSPSTAFKPKLDSTAVEILISSYTTEKDESPTRYADDDFQEEIESSGSKYLAELQENESIAQLIQNLRRENPDDTVALLARNRSHLQTIFPALSRHDLSWQATDIDSLAQRMAIIDLTSLTRALLNPGDRISWLSILRAPWCGLDLKDLHAVANANLGNQNPPIKPNDFPMIWQQVRLYERISDLSYAAQQSLAHFTSVIEPALKQRYRKPLRQWIEGIWLALGGPATLLDKQDIHDIPSFFALLDQHQQGGAIVDWIAFNESVARLFAAPRQNADSKLQVMTLHKSKGLEFDHVIIPRLHKTPRNEDQALLLWRDRLNKKGERQLLLGSLAPTGNERDSLYDYMKRETSLQLQYEATRLFYVGCTRAIKNLFLFGCLPSKEFKDSDIESELIVTDQLKNPPGKSLLASIWGQAKAQVRLTAPAQQRSHTHKNTGFQFARAGLQQLLRLKPGWQTPILVDESLLIKYRGKEFGDEENQPEVETRAAKLARHTGTLIHRSLQKLVTLPKKTDYQAWQVHQYDFWKVTLKQYGFHNDEIDVAVPKIRKAVVNTLSDSRGKWLLDHSHSHSACELAITHKEGNLIDLKLRENIIDRTFVDNGTRWIIDYKSSEPAPHQHVNDFIKQEIESYKPQLARYRACFEALGESEIKTALYFPLLSDGLRFVEVNK